MVSKGYDRMNSNTKNPMSTSTIINEYLPFKSTRSRSKKKGNQVFYDPGQLDTSLAMNYLTNIKPNRSFSQKRIPEKRGKIMSSLEVWKASSQAKLKVNLESVKKSQELLVKGKDLLTGKKYSDAIKVFTNALKINSTNYEAMFYRAITYLDIGNPTQTINELTKIIDNVPNFKNTIYLVLSISYLRVNDIMSSLKVLTKAIKKYPRFTEAYLARGQIYTILNKQYENGFKDMSKNPNNNVFKTLSVGQINERIINDFQTVIDLMPDKGLGYLGKGDSLKGIGNYAGALDCYTMAIRLDEGDIMSENIDSSNITSSQIAVMPRFKRARLLYQLKMFDQAIEDLNLIIEAEPDNARAHFYKGKILSKHDPHVEAILHFEQVIKHNQEPFLSWNSLLEIAKLRIKERDFYDAYYNLKRISLFNFKSAKLDQYQTFTEGVLYLIKRKVKKGVQLLTSLIDGCNTKATSSATTLKPKTHEPSILSTSTIKPDPVNSVLCSQAYVYRAYGYIALEQYEKAITDIIAASKISKLDSCTQYNKQLALGFTKLQKGFNEEAQAIFK